MDNLDEERISLKSRENSGKAADWKGDLMGDLLWIKYIMEKILVDIISVFALYNTWPDTTIISHLDTIL